MKAFPAGSPEIPEIPVGCFPAERHFGRAYGLLATTTIAAKGYRAGTEPVNAALESTYPAVNRFFITVCAV